MVAKRILIKHIMAEMKVFKVEADTKGPRWRGHLSVPCPKSNLFLLRNTQTISLRQRGIN
jgi:hypothetical protein